MPITITNTLTGERWVLPDDYTASGLTLDLSAPPYSPGLYDVRNGSVTHLLVASTGPAVTVPDGDPALDHVAPTWSISSNENLYSKIQVDGSYWATVAPSSERGMPWGHAVPLLSAFLEIPEPPP